jgi:tryptophan synthase beta chain
MGLFTAFKDDLCRLMGVEAQGAETLSGEGEMGVLHGFKSYFLQNAWGQITPTDAIAAGLDYPGVGPEHAFFKENQRCSYHHVTPKQAVEAFKVLARTEGIIPALESAHAIAGLLDESWNSQDLMLICLSGRGDKDMSEIIEKVLR